MGKVKLRTAAGSVMTLSPLESGSKTPQRDRINWGGSARRPDWRWGIKDVKKLRGPGCCVR